MNQRPTDPPDPSTAPKPDAVEDLNLTRNRVMCIGRALIRSRGQQMIAASLLGISPRGLSYELTYHELRPLVEIGQRAAIDETAAQLLLVQFVANYVPIVLPAPEP